MSSCSEVVDSSHGEDGNGGYDYDFKRMDKINQRKVKRLKKLLNDIHWEIKNEREEFFRKFKHMILHWKGQYPNLQDFFEHDEIDWLLTKFINFGTDSCGCHAIRFIKFMASSGCKDKPCFYKSGRPQLLRTTPVHHFVDNKFEYICWNNVLRELFKIYDRYDVNYNSDKDISHFHVACIYGLDWVVQEFLKLGQDPNCLAHNKSINPPLHLALINANVEVVKLLMASGANPNLANFLGQTPLHVLCQKDGDDDYFQRSNHVGLMEMFFKLSQDRYQLVQVDARDQVGNTPLHYASLLNNKEVIKLLLRKGADPNATNNKGSTPLHKLCKLCKSSYDNLNPCESIRTFFEINNELQHTVLVDARDKMDRTPLQWAVANLMPCAVDILLHDLGADLSNFVFPTEDYFGVQLEEPRSKSNYYKKLKLWSGALLIVQTLEKEGYELNRSDALTIMKFFDKYELFENWADIEKCYNDEEFTNTAKKKMIDQSLSLYDFLRVRPEVFKKRFHFWSYKYFKAADGLGILPDRYQEICAKNLCEKIWRGFFKRWALDPFMVLTHYRLPILCCDMIIENLNNKDLFNICLATTNQNQGE